MIKTIKEHWGVAASFCTILTVMFFLFATSWDLEAVAQMVNKDRCEAARIRLGQIEIAVANSGKEPTENMRILMAKYQAIIDQSC
mgnify:CR=1 FL=1